MRHILKYLKINFSILKKFSEHKKASPILVIHLRRVGLESILSYSVVAAHIVCFPFGLANKSANHLRQI